MLNVVAPGKLVLTFQSIPPFAVESIFALTLALVLAVPLILHIQHFLDDPQKCTGSGSKVGTGSDRAVVTHYPASMFVDTASSSSAELQLGSARKTISTPILQASGDNVRPRRESKVGKSTLEDCANIDSTKNELPLKHSSSFVATNSELPIVDISAFDYDAYRHKLIEAALRKQYNDYQPPGDVVFNSIHLNDNDSTVAVKLNNRYHHSFFDFIEEYYDATKGMSKKEAEYLHPLDHFLVKGTQRPETVERETETRRVDLVSEAAGQDDKSVRISFRDDTNNVLQRRQRGKDLDSMMKKTSRSPKPRASSAGAESTASKRPTLPRPSGKKSIPSRTTSSTDSIASKRDTLSSTQKLDDRREAVSSIDGGERESMNCTTASSIDSGSVRSESSKLRDDRSCHSRDSSVASKRDTPDKPRVQRWITGSPRMSFDKKYGSKRSSAVKMSGVSNQLPNKSSLEKNGKLKVIRSETEENVKSDVSFPLNLSKLNAVSEVAGQSQTLKLTNVRSTRLEDSGEFSAKQGRSEKFAKLSRERRQRSRTFSPVQAKSHAPSPRAELSMETSARKAELRENAPNSTLSDETVKDPANENAKTFKENGRSRVDANFKASSRERKTSDLVRGRDEEKANVAKLPGDFDQRKTAGGVMNLGAAKGSFSTNSKLSSKTLQRTTGSKANSSLNDSLMSARSVQIRPGKSPSSQRSILRSSKVEKTDTNLTKIKQNDSDSLKLPRRGSKAGIAMQAGLKKYIKNVKRVLSNRDNSDLGELASLSLTDAILPDLTSTLSSVEVQQVQNLLNMAEQKTELMRKDLPVFVGNTA